MKSDHPASPRPAPGPPGLLGLLLVALACTVVAASAAAATRKPIVIPVPHPAVSRTPGAEPAAANAVCTIGTNGPRTWTIDYLQPPQDSYYLRVSPQGCAACTGSPGVWISSVSIALEFRVPCSMPVQVSVVPMLPDSACERPDAGRTIAGPWPGVVSAASPGTYDFTLALGSAAPLLSDSYLCVTFTGDGPGCTEAGTRPRLVTSSSCTDCSTWNYYPADSADLCELLLPGTPLIFAGVDSCISPSLAAVGDPLADARSLSVWPNPMRRSSQIAFRLQSPARVRIEIVDVAGRRLRGLLDGQVGPGDHAVQWDGRDTSGRSVSGGTYFAVVRFDDRLVSRPIVLLR